MTSPADRRARITDAAIATLAREGLRGLTHRAVDQAADLPEGSCSYYFRTRQALLEATLDRLAARDSEVLPTTTDTPPTLDALVDLVADFTHRASTDRREHLLARYELMLEATRRPDLRPPLVALGEGYRQLAITVLAAAGAPDPERQGRSLIAFLDGLMLDQVAGAGARHLTRDEVAASLRELVSGMVGGSRQTG